MRLSAVAGRRFRATLPAVKPVISERPPARTTPRPASPTQAPVRLLGVMRDSVTPAVVVTPRAAAGGLPATVTEGDALPWSAEWRVESIDFEGAVFSFAGQSVRLDLEKTESLSALEVVSGAERRP